MISQLSFKGSSNQASKINWQSILNSPCLPVATSSFFVAMLAMWLYFDHSLPLHDAAWHSLYSSNIQQWLCRPKLWLSGSFPQLYPYYPPVIWVINGVLKLFFGDSEISERLILILHTIFLNFIFWRLSQFIWQDRLKTVIGLFLLNSFPLIVAMEHTTYLDLPHATLFALFLYAFLVWQKTPNWKNAVLCGLALGVDCISKQTAILFSTPCLFVMIIPIIRKRSFVQLQQLLFIGLTGIFFLATWILPHLSEFLSYFHGRTAVSSVHSNVLPMILNNLLVSSYQIGQGISPLGLICLAVSMLDISYKTLSKLFYPLLSAISGWLLMAILAYFNIPEPRYFSPAFISLDLFIAAGLSEALQWKRRWVSIGIGCLFGLMLIQIVMLSFSSAPIVCQPVPKGISKNYAIFGINEPFIVTKLSLTKQSDSWKQCWMIKTIMANEELKRVSLVNIVPNTIEYNQGTLTYLARRLKAPVSFITWRSCMPDMSDRLEFSEANLRAADWHVVKTGDQCGRFWDEASKQDYAKTLAFLIQPTKFKLVAQTSLPDGTNLLLYHTSHLYQANWPVENKTHTN